MIINSHGDAGLASIDEDYKFIAAVHKSQGRCRISENYLEKYFVPKTKQSITPSFLYERKKGVGYVKSAPLYIFQRIS